MIKTFGFEAFRNFEFIPKEIQTNKHDFDRDKKELFNSLRDYRYTYREILTASAQGAANYQHP